MTEAEWDACADPTPMLAFLRGKVSDRKLRLFAVACCRRVWPLLIDERSRKAVDIIERYLEGRAEEADLRGSCDAAIHAADDLNASSAALAVVAASSAAEYALSAQAHAAFAAAVAVALSKEPNLAQGVADPLEQMHQCGLVRDVVGNPFGPTTLNQSWLAWNDGAVRKLAQAIYDGRAFDRLPLLADALEDAGCADAAILGHCRGGEHVRGCWVIDLLLGKE